MDNPTGLQAACPCCGFRTLGNEPPGSYEICRICGWEDDPIQSGDPDHVGGANSKSLREVQKGWLNSSHNHPALQTTVTIFGATYTRDATWKPLK